MSFSDLIREGPFVYDNPKFKKVPPIDGAGSDIPLPPFFTYALSYEVVQEQIDKLTDDEQADIKEKLIHAIQTRARGGHSG
jgi:hypothetical protein